MYMYMYMYQYLNSYCRIWRLVLKSIAGRALRFYMTL